MNKHYYSFILLLISLVFFPIDKLQAQIVPVGDGSYTQTFPGTDAAGRNSFPSGSPQLSGNALGKPVPTNDWWSLLIKNDHVGNLFNYPMAMKTKNQGLVVTYIPFGVIDDQEPIIVGLNGLNASRATVADYSDWTVTMDWNDGANHLQATSGIGMPFLYFNKETDDELKITVNLGTATISGEMLIIENARNNADFVFYAPSGSTWTQSGTDFTSTLNGQNYFSMIMLPLSTTDVQQAATDYQKYAYVFPAETSTAWSYNESTSVLRTDFNVTTDVKEGVDTEILQGLLPHQWSNLAADSPQPSGTSYSSIRGEMKMLSGNTFSVENTFKGILPTLPYLNNYSDGFSIAQLNQKVAALENDGLSTWTDSYNEGQMMNRLIQTARIADKTGNIASRDKMLATVKERLEDWLTAEASEVAFLFYYNDDWSTMIGYPAGHGQDGNINDHHFHWGYFIHAAAFLEQYEPGWAAQWGEMINKLVFDAASPDRNDAEFPFLRNFSPYAGHCWANGFATFPQGNDQESTSESMQFNSSLIHWGTITGNDQIRDLGIYLYTTEQTAIEEYWLDVYERNFAPEQQYSLVSRVWGNSYDNGTFWTADIAASYGIELYPIHGGSLYLGHNQAYASKLWAEIEQNTGILTNQANDNLWHDVMWKFLSLTDPAKAIELYDSYPERNLKFGVSDAHTYYWLHSMNVMGAVDVGITADYPIAVAFNKAGTMTYVAHNYSANPISVNFSDGFTLQVAPFSMATNLDVNISSTLTSSFDRTFANGSVDLELNINSGNPTKVEFYRNDTKLGESVDSPHQFTATNLPAGVHYFYAKVFEGEKLGVSNIVKVISGNQQPYLGNPSAIPGTIEAGHYDKFEGGNAQGIAYSDVSPENAGGFRAGESVDAVEVTGEGATVGWISGGEWLEYSIKADQAAYYNMSFRYASDNNAGGGPFRVFIDGKLATDNINVLSTSGWNKWATADVIDLIIPSGEHILRIEFDGGEFNLGRLTFTYQRDLEFELPVAHAGQNVVVVSPESTATLDGTASTYSEALNYQWTQVFGPSMASINDPTLESPSISQLEDGVYLFELQVSAGDFSDRDEVLVIVSPTASLSPNISWVEPTDNSQFLAGKGVSLLASASDIDGVIAKVEFFVDDQSIGEVLAEPFTLSWIGEEGTYQLHAVATDNDGNTSITEKVNITLTPPPSCEGLSPNGDYSYLFSDDASNPTLTFLPSEDGVGSPTCILYYGTSASGPYPGYGTSPNVPFRIAAAEGETVYFYYTYSFPGQGEKNTAGDIQSYVVGTCKAEEVDVVLSADALENDALGLQIYPNPSKSQVQIAYPLFKEAYLHDLSGRLVLKSKNINLDISKLESGVYLLTAIDINGKTAQTKLMKR